MPVPRGWPVWSVPFTGSMLQKDALSEPAWKCRGFQKSLCFMPYINDSKYGINPIIRDNLVQERLPFTFLLTFPDKYPEGTTAF